METNFLRDEWQQNGSSAGMGGDGSENGWGRVGTKFAGTGGDGCNFCSRALVSDEQSFDMLLST